MNERYTYGYNNGWNVENGYINSLSELMDGYNKQTKILEEINNSIPNTEEELNASIKQLNEEIDRNNSFVFPTYSDEQIKKWYDEDYSSYSTTITFEKYKANIMSELELSNNKKRESLNERNEELSRQIVEKQKYLASFIANKKAEYVANQYYLIDIKNETRKSIFKKKRELELLLAEKNIELSSVLLEQERTKPQYDENGNVINSNDLRALRGKYDAVWLEIKKLEHALQKLDEMFAMVEFTKEETDLMMRGLTPQQKSIYDNIIKPVPKPVKKEPISPEQEDLLNEYNRVLEIYNEELEVLYELQQKYENNEIDYSEYQKYADYMVERYKYVMSLYNKLLNSTEKSYDSLTIEQLEEELKTLESKLNNEYQFRTHQENGLEQHNDNYLNELIEKIDKLKKVLDIKNKFKSVPKPEQPMMILKDKQIVPKPVPKPIPIPQNDEELTLEGIIEKVCGDKTFTDSQSSRYAASKIKVFSKPQKNNLGLAYKIVSVPRTIIGIVPKTAMKLYGMFISGKTKNVFKEMEERANNLTDKEVEVLLKEYKGARAQSFRLPKGFNNAVRARVDKYVGIRVAKINEQILENLKTINYCEKVINALNAKLQEENSPEMTVKLNDVLRQTYDRAYPAVKSIISLQIEGNTLQNGNGLHSFDEEVKALNTRMNYIGGRFSKAREYDPKLWSKVSSYSHAIEYSNDSKVVVDSFIERERIYKDNTKERRSVFNLGSKVTVGKLDYRPFVESLNYGNDPFIRDLITSVLVVSSTASLINNIKNSVESSARINEVNSKIEEANRAGLEQQQFVESVRGSGDSIEKGMIYDIKHTEGSIENLAERGVNSEYGWVLSGKGYASADAAHHLESGSLSVQNTEALLDLSSKYSSGTITYAEYLRGIHELKEHSMDVYEKYVSELSTVLEKYAASHPQFDYTAILSALRHASANPGDSVELSEVITSLYEQSLNVSNFEGLNAIEATLSAPSLVPDLVTLGAVTAKVAQENVDSKKEIKPDSNKSKEIREMIESLKAMKAELSEEEVKEIEELLR